MKGEIGLQEIKTEEFLTEEQLAEDKQRKEYFNNNINGFKLPIEVKSDDDYLKKLTAVLNEYYNFLSNNSAFKYEMKLLEDVKENNDKIIESIKKYYSGEIVESKKHIKEILVNYKDDDDNFFVSELDKSYAFRQIATFVNLHSQGDERKYKEMNEYELSFFKARTDEVTERKEMLHIPFNKRGIISTQRFSIAGIPCIYMGTTSYVCWLELGRPSNNKFYVSSYKFNDEDKKLKILNLVISEPLINGIFNRGIEKEGSKQKILQIRMLKLWPLICATSFSIVEENRKFRSEYIISQLIMHCLKELNIDGVAYLSKKGKDDFQFPQGVNLAIPVFEHFEEELYGKQCAELLLSKPYNYEAFLNLKDVEVNGLSYINKIFEQKDEAGDEKDTSKVSYDNETIFYGKIRYSDFDNYLVNKEHKIATESVRFDCKLC